MPEATRPAFDYLIVGAGLAGTLLTEALLRRGRRVRLLDDGDAQAATRVAPGIINPLAGKRLHPSWQVLPQLEAGQALYHRLEREWGQVFLHPLPITRVLRSEEERSLCDRRAAHPESRDLIGERIPAGTLGPGIKDPYGSFRALGSGWVDLSGLLTVLHRQWECAGILERECWHPGEVRVEAEGVTWRRERARCTVFCQGWRAHDNPWWDWLPFKPARGEMIELMADGIDPICRKTILNCGKWLLPMPDGSFRAGATYAWDKLCDPPSAAARKTILEVLHGFIRAEMRVTRQWVGVRPILRDYRPVIGRHPTHPSLAILNGLGSKGALSGPWVVDKAAGFLEDGIPVPKEASLERLL